MDGHQTIGDVVARIDSLLTPFEATKDERRHFLGAFRRTTIAVGAELDRGAFLDGPWVEQWEVAFATMYLDALEQWDRQGTAPGPWAVAFEAARSEDLPPLRHALLGLNAHINYDLPRALLTVVTDQEFTIPEVIARRAMDHGQVDAVRVSQVPEEDKELLKVEERGDRTWLDRRMRPFNQTATRRFLREARRKVWHNASLLSAARVTGPGASAARVMELEELAKARAADLRAPGQVLLRLARNGFGVELAPQAGPTPPP